MTNHVHLLLTPGARGATAAMLQEIGRRYVRVINTIHGRTGTLWEGRFKSSLVDTETYLLLCHRYIELNPVDAGLAPHPAAYPWSSHVHYAGLKADPLLTEHASFLSLGADAVERQAAFRKLFLHELDQKAVAQIRMAINAGGALGSETFLNTMQARLGRSVGPAKQGRPSKENADERPSPVISGKLF